MAYVNCLSIYPMQTYQHSRITSAILNSGLCVKYSLLSRMSPRCFQYITAFPLAFVTILNNFRTYIEFVFKIFDIDKNRVIYLNF